jgi:hypothetical protein
MGIVDGINVLLIFLGMSIPVIVIAAVYLLKKRLEHKQIMAAIEKGTSLSELRPAKPAGPVWIKNLTAGVTLLIIAAALLFIVLLCRSEFDELENLFGYFIVVAVLFAIGISRLIRGLLQRKTQHQPLNTENANQKRIADSHNASGL